MMRQLVLVTFHTNVNINCRKTLHGDFYRFLLRLYFDRLYGEGLLQIRFFTKVVKIKIYKIVTSKCQ